VKVEQTAIDGVVVIEPQVFGDERGYFFESFNARKWDENLGRVPQFVQDNESKSHRGVLRGLHFQKPPFAQAKLVRVVQGSVLDVAVDIRKESQTYGQHVAVHLSAENKKQLYVPEGFAHGFLTLEDNTIFSYKCTNFYAPDSEGGLLWDDPELKVNWGVNNPLIADKDKVYSNFCNFDSPF